MAGKTIYEEPKKRVGLSLTPTAMKLLQEIADIQGLRGPSEVVEQFARGLLPCGTLDRDQLRMGKLSAI